MVKINPVNGLVLLAFLMGLGGDERYARHALAHLKAWFTDSSSMMNPSLLYAQAIKGRVSGRGIGIIDTIHLIEVAKALQELLESGGPNPIPIPCLTWRPLP